MVILADMPYITSDLINQLLRKYLASGLELGAITMGNKRSLPAIFGRTLYHELHRLQGDIGARNLFLKYAGKICFVEPTATFNDMDIDTPKDWIDYKNLQTTKKIFNC